MMNLARIVEEINSIPAQVELPQWKVDLIAARLDIVTSLLLYSYHAIGIAIPTDDVINIRAAQISENADVCNRDLKAAFRKAIDQKVEKDLRTPITYGDINRASRMIAEENGTEIKGKWTNALPKLSDRELWGANVCLFAQSHGINEYKSMKALSNGQRMVTSQ